MPHCPRSLTQRGLIPIRGATSGKAERQRALNGSRDRGVPMGQWRLRKRERNPHQGARLGINLALGSFRSTIHIHKWSIHLGSLVSLTPNISTFVFPIEFPRVWRAQLRHRKPSTRSLTRAGHATPQLKCARFNLRATPMARPPSTTRNTSPAAASPEPLEFSSHRHMPGPR